MNKKINLNKKYGWKKYQKKSDVFFYKGYLNNNNFLNVFSYTLKHSEDKKKIKKFLNKLDGLFSIVLKTKRKTLLIADRINSTPLLYKYSLAENSILISDHYAGLKISKNEKLTINEFQAKHFAMTGYTFLEETIYKEIKKTSSGQYIYLENKGAEKIKYYGWMPYKEKRKNRLVKIKQKLKKINIKIIDKLISSCEGRTIVVPLSAGLDSRFILSGLVNRGYKDIITFSYGRKLNREMVLAKEIAGKIGVPWHPVIYNNAIIRDKCNAEKYESFLKYSDNLSALHFMQDFVALEQLKQNKIIPGKSIIVNGQTGDFISGNHLINVHRKTRFNDLIDNFIDKHYKNWKTLKKENFANIKLLLEKGFKELKIKKNISNKLEYLEFIEFENRQSKYIMNGQRTYDFLGYSWRLPLWDKDYLDFWAKLDVKYKKNQWLYKEILIEQNWCNIWKDIRINPQPDLLYSTHIKLLRFVLKFLFIPLGKNSWHAFEKKYLDYFLTELCYYAPFKYSTIIKDKRGFSGPNSWHVEAYLNKKKLDWKGTPIQK